MTTARVPLVQTATLRITAGQDEAAPGAAVTVALCGHWEHDGPCRWPHHTSRRADEADPERLEVRVVAVAAPGEQDAVRAAMIDALTAGRLDGPAGEVRWELLETGPGELVGDEHALADRLGRA